MHERYFDNAATTPLDPRVLEEMLPYLGEAYGNANSLHEAGRRAMHAVELARERVAALLGAEDPSQITFTSGATESNNWVLRSVETCAVSPFEHSSVYEPARLLGYKTLQNDGLTLKPPTSKIDLVSVMAVNNEVGAMWVARDFRGSAVALHSDITQALGKLPIDLAGIDFASFSAHKFYGPKGIGGLYSAVATPSALIVGGEQEGGARGGTLNVPAIAGMGAAAAIAVDERHDNLLRDESARAAVLEELSGMVDVRVNGGDHCSPYILSLSFYGLEGESLVIDLDSLGFSISSGAACSSRSTEPSHVLTAMGLDPEWRRGTVRISFGQQNDEASGRLLGKSLREAAQKLRNMRQSAQSMQLP